MVEVGEQIIVGLAALQSISIVVTGYQAFVVRPIKKAIEAQSAEITSLKVADEDLRKELTSFQIGVAEKYVSRSEIADSHRDLRQGMIDIRHDFTSHFRGIQAEMRAHFEQLQKNKIDK